MKVTRKYETGTFETGISRRPPIMEYQSVDDQIKLTWSRVLSTTEAPKNESDYRGIEEFDYSMNDL